MACGRWFRAALAPCLAAAAACGEDGPVGLAAPGGASASIVSGDGQSGIAGTGLELPLAVLVVDQAGAPLDRVGVSWAVISGGGAIPAATVTGPDGIARAEYVLATTAGPKVVRATVHGLESEALTFTATALPGPPGRLVRLGGDGQSAQPGQALPDPLKVNVIDRYGNGVPGVVVTWTVTEGGGTLTGPTSETNDSGVAGMTLVTGAAGPQAVRAEVEGLAGSPVGFSATAVATISLVASLPIPANYGVHDSFVRDGIAFVSAWNTGLIIYDVGNGIAGGTPAAPVEISRVVTSGGRVHNVWWFWNPNGEKRYLFVGEEGPGILGASSSGDIHVVDVSNLSQPVEVATYRTAGAGTHNFWMDESARVLYAAYYNGGVIALDASGTLSGDLATREIARIQPGGPGNTFVWGVHWYEGSVYATDMLSGFWQLRLVDGAFQVAGGGNNVPERYGSDQWVANGYAYSGTYGFRSVAGNALKVWRLSAGGAPQLVDSIITSGITTVSDVEVSPDGRLLMFSAEGGAGNGIHFYSLADPARPRYVASYLVSSGVHTATFAGIGGRRYVFAAKNPAGPALLILDASELAPLGAAR
jgi:hypothetical protein